MCFGISFSQQFEENAAVCCLSACGGSVPTPDFHAVQRIQDLNLRCYPQPPYSSDLALSDFHLFRPLKDAVRGRQFRSDEELKEAAYDWLVQQPKDFSFRLIYTLVGR
jgi:hypothetical protein